MAVNPENMQVQVNTTVTHEGARLHFPIYPGITVTFDLTAQNVFQLAMAVKEAQLDKMKDEKLFNEVKRGKR